MASGTETMVLTEPEPQVIHRVPRPPTEDEWERGEVKPLMQKLKEHYNDPKSQQSVYRMSNKAYVYFWFIALTEFYVLLRYVVPQQYGPQGEETVYWVKVWCAWVMTQTMANWMCTRFYRTDYRKSEDRPDLRKSLWDDYASESGLVNDKPVLDERTGFTWKFCGKCEHMMPPRSHHCAVCNRCILKRDHHCYFSGVCIGYHNQRYFIFLNFYIILASATGLYLIYPYMMQTFYPTSDFYDWLLPVTICRCVFWGSVEWNQVFMMFHLYSLWWTLIMAVGFVFFQSLLAIMGVTSHEMSSNARIRVTSSKSENLQGVFGSFWALNFLFPTILLFKQPGDGINWEKVKYYGQPRKVAAKKTNDTKTSTTTPKSD